MKVLLALSLLVSSSAFAAPYTFESCLNEATGQSLMIGVDRLASSLVVDISDLNADTKEYLAQLPAATDADYNGQPSLQEPAPSLVKALANGVPFTESSATGDGAIEVKLENGTVTTTGSQKLSLSCTAVQP